MAQKRKLQVFVSSTFTDLKEERQAAVEAILKAGHIPAGMELFTAGDQSQMIVIKKWIDESDVYLLLLGGRYGSIEPETGKSYTHLEYEYALEKGKALFSVIMSEKRLDEKNRFVGKEVLELENPQKYKEFKSIVKNKLVEEWTDLRDIKLAIHSTLADFSSRPELTGWVPGSEATNSGAIAEEIARLTKENSQLRDQINSANKLANGPLYNGLTFEQMCSLLNQSSLNESGLDGKAGELMLVVANAFGDKEPTLLHFFYQLKMLVGDRQDIKNAPTTLRWAFHKLSDFGLLQFANSNKQLFSVTQDGYLFNLRLQVEHNVTVSETFMKKYLPPSITVS